MRKILWCAGLIGLFAVIVITVSLRNPDNAVVAITRGASRDSEEILITKRDGTYEQLLKLKDGRIISNNEKWMRAQDDVRSRLLLEQTKSGAPGNYINYKDKISLDVRSGKISQADSLEPPPYGTVSESALRTAQEWRATAKPFTFFDTLKSPQPK